MSQSGFELPFVNETDGLVLSKKGEIGVSKFAVHPQSDGKTCFSRIGLYRIDLHAEGQITSNNTFREDQKTRDTINSTSVHLISLAPTQACQDEPRLGGHEFVSTARERCCCC